MSLRTDQIEITVQIKGNDAQKQLNELRKKASDLSFELSLMNKNTQEYISKNDELIKVGAEIDEVRKKLGLTNLSLKELASTRRQLTALIQSLAPNDPGMEGYKKQLEAVIARQSELKQSVSGVKSYQEKLEQGFEHLGLRVLEYLGIYSAIDVIKDFFISTIEETNKAEQATTQLKNSLENAGRADLFENFSKSAERFAQTFKAINPNDIKNVFTKLVDYGKLTESQFTSLTEVIINYAAKQGISVTEATDVMTKALEGNVRGLKTYGINVAAAHTVTERFGLIVNDLGDKLKGSETVFEGTAKGGLAILKENLVKTKESLGEFLFSLIGVKKTQDELFDKAKEKTDDYEKSLEPLLQRYDELKSKTNLNKTEHTELQGIIQKIAEFLPSAVTEFDKYGNAMDINREKVNGFLEANKGFLAQKEFQAVQDLQAKAKQTFDLIKQQTDELNSKTTTVVSGGGKEFVRPATSDEASANLSNLRTLQEKLLKDAETLTDKYGKTLPDSIQKAVDAIKVELGALDTTNKNSQKYSFDWYTRQIQDATDKLNKLTNGSKEFKDTLKELDQLKTDRANLTKTVGGGDPNADPAAAKEAQRLYDDLLKQAQEFHKKIDTLVFEGEQASKSQNQKEIDAVKQKYALILSDYKELVKKLTAAGNVKGLAILGPEKPIDTAEQKELDALNIKQQKEALTKAYDDQKITTQQFYDDQKQAQSKRFVDREINEKVYLANIAHIDAQAKQAQLDLATEYSKKTILVNGKEEVAVKEAVTDLTSFTKTQLDQRTKDLIASYRAQEAERKLIKDLDNSSATSKIQTRITIAQATGDTEGQLKAQKDLIDEEARQNKAALDQKRIDNMGAITESGIEAFALEIKINKEINDAKADQDKIANAKKIEADKAARLAQIDLYKSLYDNEIAAASGVLNVIDNINARQEAKDKKKNDAQAAVYKKQLDNKLITQKKYDDLIAKQDAEAAKKKHDLDVKQFKKKQLLSITEALIDGTLAIEKTWVEMGGFPTALPFVIAMGAVTLANVAAIASQSPPEAGQGKLLSDGPYHRDKEKGLHVVNPRTGKTELLLEKDEMVIKGDATRSNKTHTITGTPAQIGSKINSMYGGVSWAQGAKVETPKFVTQRAPVLRAEMPRIMAEGGVVYATRLFQAGTQSTGGSIDLSNLINMVSEGNSILNIIAQNSGQKDIPIIKTYVTIKDVNSQQAKYDAARRASGIN